MATERRRRGSVLKRMAGLTELLEKGAKLNFVLTHLLRELSDLAGANELAIATVERRRYKVVARHGLDDRETPPLPDPRHLTADTRRAIPREGPWSYVPLRYEARTWGVLVYGTPVLPLDEDQTAIVEISSSIAAVLIHVDRMELETLRWEARLEGEQEKVRRLLIRKTK